MAAYKRNAAEFTTGRQQENYNNYTRANGAIVGCHIS